uniref:Protein xylosyltransferase n=1 Tax=Arion vulgaris TaxID=1028688 RepID=A0A0B7AE39_9EUPU
MMLCGWVQEQITMKFRIHTKLINRGLTLLLLSLVLVATLFILQLFLYHEKHNSISTHNINTIWPYLNTNYDRAEDLKSGDSLRPATLSQHHKFSDLKYNQLKMYHSKGLTLRRQFDCQQLFENSSSEQNKVVEFHTQNQNTYPVIANDIATAFTSDCEAFKTIRQYRTDRGSFIEGEFPLAYVILVHKDFEHVERLLRTIYMPQHSICIHVDDKAPDSLKEAVASLASCFTNVILASKPQGIVYAHVSRLLADVICMSDLLKKDKSWRTGLQHL